MTTEEQIARDVVALIDRQCEIDHGDAAAWCPGFALPLIIEAITAAHKAGAEWMRERAAQRIEGAWGTAASGFIRALPSVKETEA